MNLAKLLGTTVVDVIVAELEEAKTSFPDDNWVECPDWIGIGMDINSPKPIEKTITLNQPTTSGIKTI